MPTLRYVGFWYRFFAFLVDSLLLWLLLGVIMVVVYGGDATSPWTYVDEEWPSNGVFDFALTWLLPAVVTILFWEYKLATPGKMLISARIVDADSGERPAPKQWVFRYLGYFASAIPLGLGFLWIAFDPRKQGWHDKLANTVVAFHIRGLEGRLASTSAQADTMQSQLTDLYGDNEKTTGTGFPPDRPPAQ